MRNEEVNVTLLNSLKEKKPDQILETISQQLRLASEHWEVLSQEVETRVDEEEVMTTDMWNKLKDQLKELSPQN